MLIIHLRGAGLISMSFTNLVQWYLKKCDGNWEHSHGFEISTLDNPGIRLRIDLRESENENRSFSKIAIDMESSTDWVYCEKTVDNFFEGCCHPTRIEKLIQIFLSWCDVQDNEQAATMKP
jgi:Immunity protein 53